MKSARPLTLRVTSTPTMMRKFTGKTKWDLNDCKWDLQSRLNDS